MATSACFAAVSCAKAHVGALRNKSVRASVVFMGPPPQAAPVSPEATCSSMTSTSEKATMSGTRTDCDSPPAAAAGAGSAAAARRAAARGEELPGDEDEAAEELNVFIRGIAKRRLRDANLPASRLDIRLDGNDVFGS